LKGRHLSKDYISESEKRRRRSEEKGSFKKKMVSLEHTEKKVVTVESPCNS